MISEQLIYSIIKLKLDTELMKLHSYKATNPSAKGWTVRGSNPARGETFRSRSWGSPSLPYNGYRVFSWSKAAARRWPLTPI